MKFSFNLDRKTLVGFGFLALCIGKAALAEIHTPQEEEARFQNIHAYVIMQQFGISMERPRRVSSLEWLNAIELAQEESSQALHLETFVDPKEANDWPLASKLRALRLKLMEENVLRTEVEAAIQAHALESAAIYELLNLEAAMSSDGVSTWDAVFADCRKSYPQETALFDRLTKNQSVLADQDIADLYAIKPSINAYQNGAYDHKPRIFMFCRRDRSFPCLRVMKDQDDKPVRNADGSLWSLPSLALSKYGKPFNVADGYTPQGIHLIDGVIQNGSDPLGFGKFSRIVLNFVPKSDGEANMKLLLPPSNQTLDWWNEAVVARDIGRANLRMHGTGVINNDPKTSYFPFVPTSGCIASRENTYDNVEYTDQAQLLATFQQALGLVPSKDNETKISGILYVIEIDNQSAAVSLADLAPFGIK